MFVTYPPYIREKARSMRVERRMTIDEIAERLAVSRTSVYGWVSDLPFDANTPARSAARERASRANSRRAAKLRDQARAEGVAEFRSLAEDPAFRDFVCIYIAEGYKRSRNTVSVANSDLAVIKLAQRWIQAWARNPVFYSVHHHADQTPAGLKRYWGEHLAVSADRIKCVEKSNSGQLRSRVWRCTHGVMAVGANDTLFKARLDGWIACMRAEWV